LDLSHENSGENESFVSLWKIKFEKDSQKATLKPSGVIDFQSLECSKDDFLSIQWDVMDECANGLLNIFVGIWRISFGSFP